MTDATVADDDGSWLDLNAQEIWPFACEAQIITDDWHSIPDLEAVLSKAVEAWFAHAVQSASSDRRQQLLEPHAELTIVLSDNEQVRALNSAYRDKDRPTNVLSFLVHEDGPPYALGDLILAWETVADEARQLDKPVSEHLSHLIVHGGLHLMGYDHQNADEAEAMEAMERLILAALGYDDPYAGQDLIHSNA